MNRFKLIILSLVSFSVSADVVVPTDRVTNRVVVRADTTSQSADVGSLRPGEQLEFIRNVPRWREVRLSPTETAFVTKSFTTVIDDPALDPAEIYWFKVRARDLSELQNMTEWSTELDAQVDSVNDASPPAPESRSWVV